MCSLKRLIAMGLATPSPNRNITSHGTNTQNWKHLTEIVTSWPDLSKIRCVCVCVGGGVAVSKRYI